MRSRLVSIMFVLPALLTAGAALALDAVTANNADKAPTAPSPPTPLITSPPTTVSLLPFFSSSSPSSGSRRSLMLDVGIAKPSALKDTEDEEDKKDNGGGGSSSSSSSSSKNSDRSISSCSRVRGGRFRCSEGSNGVVGPLGTMGG